MFSVEPIPRASQKCPLRGGVYGECPLRSWISTTKPYSSPKVRPFLFLLLPPSTSTPCPVGPTSWRELGRRGRSIMWENKSVVPCPSHIGPYLILLISGFQPESALPGKGEKGEIFALNKVQSFNQYMKLDISTIEMRYFMTKMDWKTF